ncbi:MAG: hypothetical protein AB7S50_15600, partial [Bacteroidales bacterium]
VKLLEDPCYLCRTECALFHLIRFFKVKLFVYFQNVLFSGELTQSPVPVSSQAGGIYLSIEFTKGTGGLSGLLTPSNSSFEVVKNGFPISVNSVQLIRLLKLY